MMNGHAMAPVTTLRVTLKNFKTYSMKRFISLVVYILGASFALAHVVSSLRITLTRR
jgi:hypothetical protein